MDRAEYFQKVKEIMSARGFFHAVTAGKGTDSQEEWFGSADNQVTVIIGKKGRFKFWYSSIKLNGAFLASDWAGPLSNEEHFNKFYNSFCEKAEYLEKRYGSKAI